MIDYREGQKVVATIEIEDQGQDFIELDVLENGVLLGDSVMFKDGRLSLVGIGTDNGTKYYSRKGLLEARLGIRKLDVLKLNGLLIYFKETGESDPLPWKAKTLKYCVTGVKKVTDARRFIKK